MRVRCSAGRLRPTPTSKCSIATVHVATVSEGGKLNIELRLKSGRGYVSADKNFDEDLALGYIPIDSVHSPVRKVNFSGGSGASRPDDRLRQAHAGGGTHGAVSPQDSIGYAAKLLKDHMAIFINLKSLPESTEEPSDAHDGQDGRAAQPVGGELELSVRSYNCLKNANIQTIGELVQRQKPRCCAPEFRAQVAERDQRDSGDDRPFAGDEDRPARPADSLPPAGSNTGPRSGRWGAWVTTTWTTRSPNRGPI